MKKWLAIFKKLNPEKVKLLALLLKVMLDVRELADHVIEVPETLESLSPLLTTIPLQLFPIILLLCLVKM